MSKQFYMLLSSVIVIFILTGCTSKTSTLPSVSPTLLTQNISYNIIKK